MLKCTPRVFRRIQTERELTNSRVGRAVGPPTPLRGQAPPSLLYDKVGS
jgi:hypothetical protein